MALEKKDKTLDLCDMQPEDKQLVDYNDVN